MCKVAHRDDVLDSVAESVCLFCFCPKRLQGTVPSPLHKLLGQEPFPVGEVVYRWLLLPILLARVWYEVTLCTSLTAKSFLISGPRPGLVGLDIRRMPTELTCITFYAPSILLSFDLFTMETHLE